MRQAKLGARGVILGALLALLLPHAAVAAIATLPGTYATFKAAMSNAPEGSTIVVAPGTYTEYISTMSRRNLYFLAAAGPGQTFIDGGGDGDGRLLLINGAEATAATNVVFDGFTFRNGNGGAFSPSMSPVVIADASPTFLNCVFSGNTSPVKGGAVVVYGAKAKPSFVNCVFRENQSGLYGGAVLVNGGHAQAFFKNCLFENNSSVYVSGPERPGGGALYFDAGGGTVQECVFRGNSTDYAGGAITTINQFSEPADTVVVRGSRFEGNFCLPHSASRPLGSEGGAIFAEGNTTLRIEGSHFTGNVAEGGAAVQSYRANLFVTDSVFDGNTSNGFNHFGGAGAISVNLDDAGDADRREAAVTVQRTMIRNNVGVVGGGIGFNGDGSHRKPGTLTLADVTIEFNLATTAGASYGNGGGLFLALADCVATRVSLLRNTAGGYGGGVAMIDDSSLVMTDSLLAGNQASVDGAMHVNPGSQPVTLTGTTVAYNNGAGTASLAHLAATPPVTVGGKAHLAWFVAPFPAGVEIAPGVGALWADGGGQYTAGSAAVAGLTADTLFELTTDPAEQAPVVYTMNGLTDTWFGAAPIPLPGVVEAEDFDRGGEKLGYHDLTAANEGGSGYRPDGGGVDVLADDGAVNGRAVGWLLPGEWLDYTVEVGQDRVFELAALVASPVASGQFYLMVDGADATGVVTVPATGGSATWSALPVAGEGILLARGQHQLRVVIVQGGFNLDGIRFTGAGPRSAITLAAEPAQVLFGAATVLSGVLTVTPEGGAPAPLEGETVSLEARGSAQVPWEPLGTTVTAVDGGFSFSPPAPAATTLYRALWGGGTVGAVEYPAAAGTAQAAVQPGLTLEATGYKKFADGYFVYAFGKKVYLGGALAPEHASGQVKVAIQRLVSGKWKRYKSSTRLLGAGGLYTWAWKPAVTGKFRIVATFAGDADHLPGASGPLLVKVK